MRVYAVPLLAASMDWAVEDPQGLLLNIGRFAFSDYNIAPDLARRIDYVWDAPFDEILQTRAYTKKDDGALLTTDISSTKIGKHALIAKMPVLVVSMKPRFDGANSFAGHTLDFAMLKSRDATTGLALKLKDTGDGWRGYEAEQAVFKYGGAMYEHDFTKPRAWQFFDAAINGWHYVRRR